MPIQPTRAQIEQFRDAGDAPVVMLNLLKFKPEASDGSGSGAAAYDRYCRELTELIGSYGGDVIFMGKTAPAFIGDAGTQEWDGVLVVRYTSRAAFLEMIADPAYNKAYVHRDAGLEDTLLIPCDFTGRFAD